MGNEVAKKQPFTTALAQIQDKFTNAVVNAGKAMNIQYNEYQSACMMNMLGKMQALAVENQLDILKMDYSQITNILQTVAMLNLNISAIPRECYIIIRSKKVGNNWKKEFEFNIEGDGNDKLLRKFGVGVKEVRTPWLVRENDEFTYPSFNGLEVTPPTWTPKDYTSKVVRVVYPIIKDNDMVEFHIAEREGVVHNLQAHIANNLMKNREVKNAAELNQMAATKTLDEILSCPELLPHISPAWKNAGSSEAMIIRKMKNNATKKFPKDFQNAFTAAAYESAYEDYEQYKEDERINKEEAVDAEIIEQSGTEHIETPKEVIKGKAATQPDSSDSEPKDDEECPF